MTGPFGQDQRQRAWPEGIHELPGALVKGGDVLGSRVFIPDMNNQRIKLGPVLGSKDFGHRLFVQRVRAQTVDGFRGEGHDLSGPEPFGRVQNCPWVVAVKDAGHRIGDWGLGVGDWGLQSHPIFPGSDRYSCPGRLRIL